MQEENIIENAFCVELVEKTTAPVGAPDAKWHRYVIGTGNAKIEGKKRGSLQAVTDHAETLAQDLNLRKANPRSIYSYGSSKQR